MLTVVRLADDLYAAYDIETGFLAYGSVRSVANAVQALGIKKHEVVALFRQLQTPPEEVQNLDIPLILEQSLRQKLRSRQT
jgi:hypothetical protein